MLSRNVVIVANTINISVVIALKYGWMLGTHCQPFAHSTAPHGPLEQQTLSMNGEFRADLEICDIF